MQKLLTFGLLFVFLRELVLEFEATPQCRLFGESVVSNYCLTSGKFGQLRGAVNVFQIYFWLFI